MTTPVASRGLVRWVVVLVVLVVLGIVAVSLLQRQEGGPTGSDDPRSPSKTGSLAVARLLQQRGVTSTTTTSLNDAVDTSTATVVVVTYPDAYSSFALNRLGARHRLVLLAPGQSPARVFGLGTETAAEGTFGPDCDDEVLAAAGRVEFGEVTLRYTPGGCYGGRAVRTDRVTAVGDPTLFDNRYLAETGRAALAMNVLGAASPGTRLVWLRPGVTAASDAGGGSAGDLFPSWVGKAALWLFGVGVLVTLWRGRRLGRPISEPLPVIVRSVEVVEGRGRLYARAHDRERAARALREAAVAAVVARRRLPRHTSALDVVHDLEASGRWPGGQVWSLLLGPAPGDDIGLQDLAERLDVLVRDADDSALTANTVPTRPRG